MAVDQPGPPEGSDPDQPGQRPTEPLARPVQSIGNKIMGIRVLDAGTGRPLPYVRAFVGR